MDKKKQKRHSSGLQESFLARKWITELNRKCPSTADLNLSGDVDEADIAYRISNRLKDAINTEDIPFSPHIVSVLKVQTRNLHKIQEKVTLLLFFQVWGDSDAEPFPVKIDGGDTIGELKKLIIIEGPLSLRDMRAPNLKLWKWNKPDMVTDSDLDSNTVLNPMVKIEGIFKNDPPQEACVHIIIRTPERVTTRKRSAPVQSSEVTDHVPKSPRLSQETDTLSFPEPDWSNLGSIYTWFQRFTLQRGRNPLVGTFGRDFKFLGREKTIEALWDGNGLRPGIAKRFEKHNEHDKNLHPIPILAGGPGTGKSRFLDEIEGLIFCCASKSPDMNIQKGFENMAVINVNYGNGSAASDMDIRIGAQASLSLRLLFEYFRPQDSPKAPLNYGGFVNLHAKNPQHLTLHTALSVIAKDFTTHKQKGSDATVVIVVGIDEINRLHDWNKEVLRHLIHSIGAVMCSPPTNIYFIPILAGTIEGPLERYISGSMHKALPLPLPLLSVDDAIKISNLGEVDGFEEYVALNPSFRMSVSDLGGHARTLEYFYERFTQLVKQDKCSFSDINIVKIISKVRDTISDDYQLKRLPKQLEGVAIKVLLNQEVRESDLVAGSGESYRDFSDRGVLSLIPSPRHGFWKIRIPYLWLCTFMEFSDSPVRKYWEEMLKYDEPMYWQNFEIFNLKFLAMRLTLLRMTGLTKVDLKELLQGAIFSEQFPEVDIILPTEARLGQMRYRYPETETRTIRQSGDNAREFHTTSGVSITKIDCLPNEDIYKHCGRVILNAPGACWDLFMFLEIQYRGKAQGKIGTLCLTGQVKKASVESSNPLVANDHLISTEHAKAAKAVSNIPVDEWVYLFLADAETRNLDIKTKDNCAFVGDGEFANFYGYSYSSRAQFASANEIIYINHAYPKSLQILGFSEEEAKDIVTKRKRRCFDSLDDVRKRLGLGNKRLQNTISFARLT